MGNGKWAVVVEMHKVSREALVTTDRALADREAARLGGRVEQIESGTVAAGTAACDDDGCATPDSVSVDSNDINGL